MRKDDEARALDEVTARVVAELSPPFEEIVAESIYHERRRLEAEHDPKIKREDGGFWDEIHTALLRTRDDGAELRGLIARIVRRYTAEIAGHFDERVYQAVTRAGPPALGLLLNAVTPKRLITRMRHLPTLDDAVILQGETEHLKRLHERGTVLLVPTHVSNMDSIIVGFALYRLGLPPFVYGAGLNLFSNPLIGFFMHHLGAYTVDRKKKDPLYVRTLKHYAGLTLELGYDNIFFPGGTRCRSGAIERHLKLGLMGTAVGAYVSKLERGADKQKVFVVPATLSYQLVLEAETLIDDFLAEVGKSRYIISDDEFSQPRRVFDFITQLFALDSKIYFTISRGLDPFGNPVDDDGNSLDPCGRVIDIERYVLSGGKPARSAGRDAEYTREVGERVAEAYARDNVVQSTHVAARAIFGAFRRANRRTFDLLRLIRVGGRPDALPAGDVLAELDGILGAVRALAERGGIRLDTLAANGTAAEVLAGALRHFATYHRTPAALRDGELIVPRDRQLLFYYQNRLEGYGLPPEPDVPPALSPDHRALGVNA